MGAARQTFTLPRRRWRGARRRGAKHGHGARSTDFEPNSKDVRLMKPLKILLSLGTAVAAGKLAHMASSLRLEDVLGTMGLERRRSRLLESILLVGAGAAVGAG